MVGRAGRIGLVITTMLLLALPLPGWAGSSQAALAVGVIVPARCAVQTPGTLAPSDLAGRGAGESVAMRCTKGILPAGIASSANPGTVGPQITRDLVLISTTPGASAPRPLTEMTVPVVGEAAGLVITVNF
jgi:hypothetical protein